MVGARTSYTRRSPAGSPATADATSCSVSADIRTLCRDPPDSAGEPQSQGTEVMASKLIWRSSIGVVIALVVLWVGRDFHRGWVQEMLHGG